MALKQRNILRENLVKEKKVHQRAVGEGGIKVDGYSAEERGRCNILEAERAFNSCIQSAREALTIVGQRSTLRVRQNVGKRSIHRYEV